MDKENKKPVTAQRYPRDTIKVNLIFFLKKGEVEISCVFMIYLLQLLII